MNIKNLKWGICALALLASCGGKDNTDINNPEGPQGSGEMQQMTPEESKEFLQNTSTEFLNKFKPNDQKSIIELAAYFTSEFEDFEAPEEFEIEPDGIKRTPAPYLKALAQAAKGDVDALTRAAVSYTYTLKFDLFAGVYEPDYKREVWVKTGNSKDIVFKFFNKDSQPVEVKISQSGGTSEVDFWTEDWDYDWGENGYYEYDARYNYFLSIPKNISASVTENGKELAQSTVVSSIDIEKHTFQADVNATVMNIKANAVVSGTNTKVEARTDIFLSGEKVADTYATLNGNHLCDKSRFESMNDMDDDQIEAELLKMLKTADMGVNILDKVQVYGQMEYYRELGEDLDFYADNYDYSSKEDAKKECQKVCDRMNGKFKTQLRYNKKATNQATFILAPYFWNDSWYGKEYWECYPSLNILFTDGTTYSVESYFDQFTNVENKLHTLLNAYERIWVSAGGEGWSD